MWRTLFQHAAVDWPYLPHVRSQYPTRDGVVQLLQSARLHAGSWSSWTSRRGLRSTGGRRARSMARHATRPAACAADPVRSCLAEIRAKAGELRQSFGDEPRARALEWAAECVEHALHSAEHQLLSLAEAARLSGYSEEHLARLVRTGRIPDRRPPGSRGRIYIAAADLPTRPVQAHTPSADVHELASRLFGGEEGHHGQP